MPNTNEFTEDELYYLSQTSERLCSNLRSRVRESIQVYGDFGYMPADPNSIYSRYFNRYVGLQLMNQSITDNYGSTGRGKLYDHAIVDLCQEDIEAVGDECAAALAWMTIDGKPNEEGVTDGHVWRLHHEYPDKNIPTDLRYGLVLRYAIPVLKAVSAFGKWFSLANELEKLSSRIVSRVQQRALEHVMGHYPNESEGDVISKIRYLKSRTGNRKDFN